MSTSPAGATTPSPAPATPPASRQNSPESLDSIIATTRPRGWWALWAIFAIVLAVLVWSIVATIPLQKSATGIVSPYTYSYEVTATTAGIFEPVTATSPAVEGWKGNLRKGDEIGTITPFDGGAPVSVVAPVDGSLSALYVARGAGVEPGTAIGQVTAQPDPATGLEIITYVPFSTAYSLSEGTTAAVTVNDATSGETYLVSATIQQIADTPASSASMTTLSGSPALASAWEAAAGGQPYRINLTLDLSAWPQGKPYPAPGVVVAIVSTYGEVHPIELLFGGAS